MSLPLKVFNAIKQHHRVEDIDPRMQDLPLVSNFSAQITIVAAYLIFVLKVGPAYMAKRKPYNLTFLIQCYNCFQILLNLYIFSGAIHFVTHPKYNWFCVNVDRSDTSRETLSFKRFSYLYFLSKFLDLMETVFFVLRKKFNQVSFLHLYHHVLMIYGTTVYHNFLYGSQFTTVGIINSLVHVMMYIYYFAAARVQNKERLAAWKPRMTELQILQFFYIAVKILFALVNNTCGLPYFWLWLCFVQNFVIVGLFSHFYWKEYIVKPRKLKAL